MTKRATPNYVDEQACIADIERLEKGYTPTGAWTLPQACWHAWMLVKDAFHEPATTELTPKQKEAHKFIDAVCANGWPDAKLDAPPMAVPPPDAGTQAVTDLIGILRTMASYPHSQVDHFFFGAVDIAKFRRFVLNHIAHHLAFLVPTTLRRPGLKYADEAAMIADIARLRRGYTMGGNWSLAQICWHINLAFPLPFVEEPAQTPLTDAQVARQTRWDHYIAHGKAPPGFEAPPELVPPKECSEADVDGLVQRLHDLAAFKGKFMKPAAGVMPIERARGFMLAHGALHLSCLHPTHRRREGLSFASEIGIINEVKRLREGYLQSGKWTLAMVCWHLSTVLPYPPEAGDANVPVTPQQERGRAFLEAVKKHGGPPPGFEAPDHVVPAASCGASAIDDYLAKLEAFSKFNEPMLKTEGFGAVDTAFYRQLSFGHAARHLSFLRPIKGPREGLSFADEDAAIGDIQRLRLGYEQVGGWSLPQVCWHLCMTMQARLVPGPHAPNTPEQDGRKPIFNRLMTAGELPRGIIAPSVVTPPADAGDDAIDACLAKLAEYKTFVGPFAPHRLFGHMSDADAHRHNLIHVAHHLSHLVPSSITQTK